MQVFYDQVKIWYLIFHTRRRILPAFHSLSTLDCMISDALIDWPFFIHFCPCLHALENHCVILKKNILLKLASSDMKWMHLSWKAANIHNLHRCALNNHPEHPKNHIIICFIYSKHLQKPIASSWQPPRTLTMSFVSKHYSKTALMMLILLLSFPLTHT